MSEIEKAKLFDVAGPADKPKEQGKGIAVQFNPSSLKVTLANSIKENERSGNSRATQYVDKSSSSLSVELIFDTSLDWENATERTPERHKDVRLLTKAIAEAYMHQKKVGDKKTPPKRCMFVWGTFVFVGVMESFDETLDFFAPEGTPLRATVSLKMTESRFQFETRAAKAASRDTPQLGTGSDPVEANWRDKAMYNGTEAPRMPESPTLASPGMSASSNLASGFSKPSFSVGSSSSLGTSIPGAFSATSSGPGPIKPPGLTVSSSSAIPVTAKAPIPVRAKASISFD